MGAKARLFVKSEKKADEVHSFLCGKGKVEKVRVGEFSVIKATFEPGWSWELHEKPIAKTKTCLVAHLGYCVSGVMRILPDGGEPRDIRAGDFFAIPPGHLAHVVGDEPCVLLDFGDVADWAPGAAGYRRAA